MPPFSHPILLGCVYTSSLMDSTLNSEKSSESLGSIENESFELLVKRVFGNGNSCPVEFVELGQTIAQKCEGVPLEIVLIAGILIGRTDKRDWERVDKNVSQYLYEENKDCGVFVEMSYNCLTQDVQTCFLYCGVFPRGFDIPCWKLIRLWIAEGLIKPQQSFTLKEIAEFYLNDLVQRNLVILLQKRSDGQIKTCRLHNMLHEFCRKEASNKWLFQNVCPTPDNSLPSIQDSDTCRRLCINHLLYVTFSPQNHLQNMSDLSIVFPQNKNKLNCLVMKSNY